MFGVASWDKCNCGCFRGLGPWGHKTCALEEVVVTVAIVLVVPVWLQMYVWLFVGLVGLTEVVVVAVVVVQVVLSLCSWKRGELGGVC